MTVDDRLDALRTLIQHDIGNRGLARDPADNLLTHTLGDFAAACRSIAEAPNAGLAVITGFHIPTADPPAGETDGPLGAVFLARALVPAGIRVAILTDDFCERGLAAGLEAIGLRPAVPLLTLPPATVAWEAYLEREWQRDFRGRFPLTHLIALERVGPSHADDRCYTMRGRDITDRMAPAHRLVEHAVRQEQRLTTVGIGDGGNEIGMGKVPRDTIRRNIPYGDLIACRVPTDHLIVAGVSNWGAYALAVGVLLLRGEKGGKKEDAALFDPDRERRLLQVMVEQGPLVDGVTGRQTATVDGLTWEQYAGPLVKMGELLRGNHD
jgi:hypothetical protein